MTARDYYYSAIAPQENGHNYQAHHAGQNCSLAPHILEMIPTYSNDYLLDQIIPSLAERTDGAIQHRLLHAFVAKQSNLVAGAIALDLQTPLDGDLVLFNVGLSDAIFQYSLLFSEMVNLGDRIRQGDYEASEKLSNSGFMLGCAEDRWIEDEGLVTLTPFDALSYVGPHQYAAAAIAKTTDIFITAHELAHHLLGHTGNKNDGYVILQRAFPERESHHATISALWQQELDADALAVWLVAGLACEGSSRENEGRVFEAAVGSLFTLAVIGQLTSFSLTSDTHPPVDSRYRQILEALDIMPGYDHSTTHMVENFQRLMTRHSEGVGLMMKRSPRS